MNTPTQTPFGKLLILEHDGIFKTLAHAINHATIEGEGPVSVGLSGGSTPKTFYSWAIRKSAFSHKTLERVLWTTSDERCVPLENEESNFGTADRILLSPLKVLHDKKLPWPVRLEPKQAAQDQNHLWSTLFHNKKCFDICHLGMGEDCHTASLFPNSPLIGQNTPSSLFFAAVEVPEKGWRLTLTPHALRHCTEIFVTVTGKNKADAVREVLEGDFNPKHKPIQLLGDVHKKVTWLLDAEAASKLS